MNGGHDLGGMHGLGPIDPEDDEPVFHSIWEQRAFALTLASGSRGEWNIDQSRFSRESMEPGEYLRTSYYEHWLHGLEVLLEERGYISDGEIDARMASEFSVGPSPGFADTKVLKAERVAETMGRGGSTRMAVNESPRFSPGDEVRTVTMNPAHHTRLPRYARDKTGVVEIDHGGFVFPDIAASTGEKTAQRLYAVRFRSIDLWGDVDGNPNDTVVLDLFDSYLLERG